MQANGFSNLTGATAGSDRNWSWCVPSIETPHVPIAILCMTRDGPRYVPTCILPPLSLRPAHGAYREVRPSLDDFDLAEAVYTWRMVDSRPRDLKMATKATLLANDVCTARRFLSRREDANFSPALQPVEPKDLCYGRSVILREGASTVRRGWLVGVAGDFDVVIHRPVANRFELVSVGLRYLGEDGTADAANKLLNSQNPSPLS